MPIDSYEGKTFVAFTDISGFKIKMKDEKEALKALDRLYQYGYDIIRNQNSEPKVEGLFVSDSGIMFVRNDHSNIARTVECLQLLMRSIKTLNKRMLRDHIMLTTSIAYGKFKYQDRIEISGVEKAPLYGDAYVHAYLDNEAGKPKIQPGQCRIIKEDMPDEIKSAICHNHNRSSVVKEKENHYYFYWMLDSRSQIDEFEKAYKDAYNLRFQGYLNVLENLQGTTTENREMLG
ncbi:MAG: hypothetical protein ACOC38_10965 [Promethearchaeia archaeon]